MEKQKNIPQLRFPQFTDEWVYKKLEDFTSITSGFAFKSGLFSDTGNKLVIPKNFTNTGFGNFSTYHAKYTLESPDSKYLCSDGDLLLLLTDLTPTCELLGKPLLLRKEDGDVLLNQRVIKINRSELINNKFLASYFLTEPYHKIIKETASGSTVKHSSNNIILNLVIPSPSQLEQEQIAAFFTAVDEKIQFLKKQATLLKEYKKGVMQKIFSQELRFKNDNGEGFPDWQKKKLNQIYTFKTTNSLSRDNLNYESGDVKNIHYGDIHTKFQTLFDITKEFVPYINPELSFKKASEDYFCKEGDLIFADASEDYNDVGKCIELVHLNNEKVVAGLHTIHAQPNLESIAIGFGGYLMKSNEIRKQIMFIAQGTKVLSISAGRLGELELLLPDKKEQTKIATFLKAIDDKIELVATQIEKTGQWKKGLLQQMFC